MLALLTVLFLATPLEATGPDAPVKAWLAAQNAADFKAYEVLYATKFQGVKRAGERVYRFDRAGWLKDRKRMFSPKVKVEMTDLQSRALGTELFQYIFTQRWTSGKYEDVGTKRLTVYLEDGVWKIAREEMVTSNVKRDLTKQAPLVATEFAPVWAGRIVLGQGFDAAAVDASKVSTQSWNVAQLAVAPVDRARLSAADQAWIGRKVRVYDAAGLVCETEVSGLEVIAPVTPHFGFMQEMQAKGAPAWAEALWDLAPEGRRLAATLKAPCEGGLWARAADLPAPTVWAPIEDAALAKQTVAALRKVPRHTKLQREFKAQGGKGWWDEEESSPWVATFAGPEGARLASAAALGAICGGFGGTHQAIWAVEGEAWRLLTDPKEGGVDADVVAAVSLGAGQPPTLLLRDRMTGSLTVMRRVGDRYEVVAEFGLPYQDCPC